MLTQQQRILLASMCLAVLLAMKPVEADYSAASASAAAASGRGGAAAAAASAASGSGRSAASASAAAAAASSAGGHSVSHLPSYGVRGGYNSHYDNDVYYQPRTAYFEGGYIAHQPKIVTGASGNIKSLSKLPVVGKILYNPRQKEFHAAMKAEKGLLRHAKKNYESAFAAAPKVPGRPHLRKKKRHGVASKLVTDPVIMSNDDVVEHHQNVQLYKNLIKNKPVVMHNSVYVPPRTTYV